MIATKASENIEQAVAYELLNITEEHGKRYNTPHEGYAVLLEEVQEAGDWLQKINNNLAYIWAVIKGNHFDKAPEAIRELSGYSVELAKEAVQVAAVCDKYMSGTVNN